MARRMITLHSPLSPAQFEVRFTERVDPDSWWLHGPMVWFAGSRTVLGEMDGDSFTLRRPATFSRRKVPILIFHGQVSPDPIGGTRIEGYFALHPLPVLLARVGGIGMGMLMLIGEFGMRQELQLGAILVAVALILYGFLFTAVARLFAGGTEAFLLDFLRKNLLAQVDQAEDLPILDSAMR
jgi:hypothetical protein